MSISTKVGFASTIRLKGQKSIKSLLDQLIINRDISTIRDISDL
ncbi:2708_t:CDS:1, partial [Gigaspora rosea]